MAQQTAKTLTIAIGEAGEIVVDVTALQAMPAVSEYIWNYGIKQMLNDVHAGLTKKVEADDQKRKEGKRALVEKKLASLMAGEVAQARVGATGDPVEREIRAMAETDVKAKIKAAGRKISDFSKESLAAAIAKQAAAHDTTYRPAAIAKLAIKPEAVETADDIMALLAEAETAPNGE